MFIIPHGAPEGYEWFVALLVLVGLYFAVRNFMRGFRRRKPVYLKKAKPLDGLLCERPARHRDYPFFKPNPRPRPKLPLRLNPNLRSRLGQNRSVGRNRCLCGRLGAGFESLAGNDNSETYRVRPQLWFCPLSALGTREKGRAGLLEASRSRRGWNRLRTVAATSEQSVLSFIANRSSFLIGELLFGKLSEPVVVVGNAPHNRP